MSFVTADTLPEEDQVHFWENWAHRNDGKTWNQLYVDAIERNGMTGAHEATGITTELLLDAWERFKMPIRSHPAYALEGQMSVSELISMKTSELLCERIQVFASPPSFPLGFVDSSYQGMETNWKDVTRGQRSEK